MKGDGDPIQIDDAAALIRTLGRAKGEVAAASAAVQEADELRRAANERLTAALDAENDALEAINKAAGWATRPDLTIP